MIKNNSYTPNIELTVEENKENKVGSVIKLDIRAEYVDKYSTENLVRYIKRAYHNFAIDFMINNISFNTSECKLYEVLSTKKYIILYDTNKNIFSCICESFKGKSKDNENKIIIESLKREINKLEEKKSYEEVISKCDEIIKIANESGIKNYVEFEKYLDYAIEKLKTIRIDKEQKEKMMKL